MPQAANITVVNHESANVTYDLFQAQAGSTPATWFEKSSSLITGRYKLTHLVTTGTSSTKVSMKLKIPTVDVDGLVTKQNFAAVTINLDHRSTEDDREEIAVAVSNLLAHALIKGSIVDAEPAS